MSKDKLYDEINCFFDIKCSSPAQFKQKKFNFSHTYLNIQNVVGILKFVFIPQNFHWRACTIKGRVIHHEENCKETQRNSTVWRLYKHTSIFTVIIFLPYCVVLSALLFIPAINHTLAELFSDNNDLKKSILFSVFRN